MMFPLEFVRNCVEWDSLIHNKSMTYTYKEMEFPDLLYSSDRQGKLRFLSALQEG